MFTYNRHPEVKVAVIQMKRTVIMTEITEVLEFEHCGKHLGCYKYTAQQNI